MGKPKGGVKGRGAAAAAPEPGTWELLGSDPETLTDLGHKLQRSKRREDRAIAAKARPLLLWQPSVDLLLGYTVADCAGRREVIAGVGV